MPNPNFSQTVIDRATRPVVTTLLNPYRVSGPLFNKQVIVRVEKRHKIDLLLHNVLEKESSDGGLQGSTDEVYAWEGVAMRSDILEKNSDNQLVPQTQSFSVPSIQDIDLTSPYETGITPPYPVLLHSFNLGGPVYGDTYYSVTLFVIEHDNGHLGDSLKAYSEQGIKALKDEAATIAEELVGDAGAAIGGAIGGPVGAFIGKVIVGKLIGLGIDKIVDAIVSGLNDDRMKPFVFNVLLDDQDFSDLYGTAPVISTGIKDADYRDDGAYYIVSSEWKLYREVKQYTIQLRGDYRSVHEEKANEHQLVVPAGANGRCSGAGFTATVWTVNRDYEFVFSFNSTEEISDCAWYISGQRLSADGIGRSLVVSTQTIVYGAGDPVTANSNITIKYTLISNRLVITSAGKDGNYELLLKLVCLDREVINDFIQVNGQEFAGDEKYQQYMDCIWREMQYKASVTPLPVTVSAFVPEHGPLPFERFSRRNTDVSTFNSNLFHVNQIDQIR